ncbi:hypothetical protein [Kutzneria albida]|nr:hypothetical protein [Kutzneria albida]
MADWKLAMVAWNAVEDAAYRSIRMTGTHGRGLRGGSSVKSGDHIDYQETQFTVDSTVTGHAVFDRKTNALNATVTVNGSDTLTMTAPLFDGDAPYVKVTGTIDGRPVSLLAPAR